jgi:hypothetical protein
MIERGCRIRIMLIEALPYQSQAANGSASNVAIVLEDPRRADPCRGDRGLRAKRRFDAIPGVTGRGAAETPEFRG